MIKILFLIIFLLMTSHGIRADQTAMSGQDFAAQLDNVKNPFEDGLPKPVIVPPPKPVVYHIPTPKPQPKPQPKPKFVPPPPAVLPDDIHLDGVMVGDEMHEAIINGEEVSLLGTVEGATLVAINKGSVELLYKGKKFVLKVD